MSPDGRLSASRQARTMARMATIDVDQFVNICQSGSACGSAYGTLDFESLIHTDPALTHGLDTLGNCNNDTSCVDQRCLSHFDSGMGANMNTTLSPGFDTSFLTGVHGSNPASALQSPGLQVHSLDASPGLHGLGSEALPNFHGSDSRNDGHAHGTPWATSSHFNHHHNQPHFNASPSPFSNHGQLPHGGPLYGWEPLFHNSNAITDPSFSATPFGTHPSNAHYSCAPLAGFDDCGSMDCSSRCEVNCWNQCDSSPGVCCFDETCTQGSSRTICCYDEDCGGNQLCVDEPCVDELCQGASHPCTDVNCIGPGTTVSSTPASATIRTPPSFHSITFPEPFSPTYAEANFGMDQRTKRRKPNMPLPDSFSDLMNKMQQKNGGVDSFSTPSLTGESTNGGDAQTMNLENQYMCHWQGPNGICGEVLKNDEELQNHCKSKHLACLQKEAEGFKCRWGGCTRESPFTQKSKLERHLQTHTGFKPVKCHICGLQLSAKQSLDQHLRIHSGEKPWKCKFPGCTQAFKQQSALTMHERTHTGEKPLKCEICGKTFGESSNLSKHRRIHNKTGGFFCQLCGRDFHRQDQLRRHMLTNHKVDPKAQTPKTEPGMKSASKSTPVQLS